MREFLTGQGILSFFDAPWVPLFLALCFAFHPWLGMVATAGALIIAKLAAWLLTAPFLGAFDPQRMATTSQLWRPFWAMILAALGLSAGTASAFSQATGPGYIHLGNY